MNFTHTFVTVVNTDGSIITCPKTSLKEEKYLFTPKKKVISELEVRDASDYLAKQVAGLHHEAVVEAWDNSDTKVLLMLSHTIVKKND